MKEQSRRSFLSNNIALSAGIMLLPSGEMNKRKMLNHHVFFWLRNPDSKEDLARLINGLQTLKKIKTVRKIYIGVPAATEDRTVVDSSFSVSELLFFNDLAGQKTYQDHPIHQQFITDCAHLWTKVVVYDSVDI